MTAAAHTAYKVEAFPVKINGQTGYDIRINDPEATVQDYIDAIDRFIEEVDCYRSRKPEIASCFGCDLCCQERIPLTVIDARRLTANDIRETLNNLLHVYVDGRVVDITMGLDESGRCRFLDPEKGICRSYHKRPMVCRTFICCPSTRKARQLREEIVNSGEDELVRTWFTVRDRDGNLIIHEGINPMPAIEDYPKTPFAGAEDYSHVKLKHVCSRGLWKKLCSSKT